MQGRVLNTDLKKEGITQFKNHMQSLKQRSREVSVNGSMSNNAPTEEPHVNKQEAPTEAPSDRNPAQPSGQELKVSDQDSLLTEEDQRYVQLPKLQPTGRSPLQVRKLEPSKIKVKDNLKLKNVQEAYSV